MKQLELFKEATHLFCSVDSKQKDFIAFNATSYKMTEEDVLPEDLIPLKYKTMTEVIQNLKSQAWSSGCTWFFVLQDEGVYLMNVYKENFWLCRKHSFKFIKMFLDNKPKFENG